MQRKKNERNNHYQARNKLTTDLKVATSRIDDLKARRDILMDTLYEFMQEKRRLEKENMENDDKLTGRNLTELDAKEKYAEEEQKMYIGLKENHFNMKLNGNAIHGCMTEEENRGRELLEWKLDKEKEYLDLTEHLEKLKETAKKQREQVIKLRVQKSELETADKFLNEENKETDEKVALLEKDNEETVAQNDEMKAKIHATIQRININDLLRGVDLEDMKM